MKPSIIIMISTILVDSKETLRSVSTYPFIASITHILQKPCSGVLYTRDTLITIKRCAQHIAKEYIIAPYTDDKKLVPKLGIDFFNVNEIISEESERHGFSSKEGLSVMKLNSTDSRSTGIILDLTGATTLKEGEVRLIGWSHKDTFLPPFKSLGDGTTFANQNPPSGTNFQFSYGKSSFNYLACKYDPGSLLVYYGESGKPTLAGIRDELPCQSKDGLPTYVGIAPRWLWIHVVKEKKNLDLL